MPSSILVTRAHRDPLFARRPPPRSACSPASVSTQTPRFYPRRSDRARAGIAGRVAAQPYEIEIAVRDDRTTCSSPPATSRRARARRTSTRSTKCRTRAGSRTGSARRPSPPTRSRAARTPARRPIRRAGCSSGRRPSGVHPGFTARDAKGETWFLEFDPPALPGRRDRRGRRSRRRSSGRSATTRSRRFLTTFDPKRVEIRPEGDDAASVRRADAVHAGRHERDPRTGRADAGRDLSRRRRPPDSREDPRQLPVRRHASRRSERPRAARAPPRAARAPRLRCVDEPHRSQGGATRSTRS